MRPESCLNQSASQFHHAWSLIMCSISFPSLKFIIQSGQHRKKTPPEVHGSTEVWKGDAKTNKMSYYPVCSSFVISLMKNTHRTKWMSAPSSNHLNLVQQPLQWFWRHCQQAQVRAGSATEYSNPNRCNHVLYWHVLAKGAWQRNMGMAEAPTKSLASKHLYQIGKFCRKIVLLPKFWNLPRACHDNGVCCTTHSLTIELGRSTGALFKNPAIQQGVCNK